MEPKVTLLDQVRMCIRKAVLHLPAGVQKPVVTVMARLKPKLRIGVRGTIALVWFFRKLPSRLLRAGPDSLAYVANRIADHMLDTAVRNGPTKTKDRLEKGKGRTLWGVTPILTLPLKARADRLLGFESHSLVFITYYITQNFEFNLRWLVNGIAKNAPRLSPALEKIILAWAISRYDVFHFFYDRGLMAPVTRFGINPEELEFLRTAGKRVYGYAYGADVRRRNATLSLGKWNFCSECPDPQKFCVCDDTGGFKVMQDMCAKLTAANALGDMLTYVPNARNMHYWPIDLNKVPFSSQSRLDGPLVIAHAPNHGHFKGTHYLEAAIDKLRKAGREIEYVKVQGVPNTEVIRMFGEADVVADQFIGGAYGYTALEAMARGKPVMSFVRSANLVEAADECPLINTSPDTIDATLLWLLENRERLQAIGAQGRHYVEKWHSIEAVAARLGAMYESTANFPTATMENVFKQRDHEHKRKLSLPVVKNWQHPFAVGAKYKDALLMASAPLAERWTAANLGLVPRDEWHSYDRSPWKQPWMNAENISAFSAFSEAVFAKFEATAESSSDVTKSFGFVSNIANINYMRANALRRHISGIALHLVKSDNYIMSLPAWEDFDGEITELGDDPVETLLGQKLPASQSWLDLTPDWQIKLKNGEFSFIDPQHVMGWPSYMPLAAGLESLRHHDALLVSQFLHFGLMSQKPYIIGQMGGEIWFDAARDDELGHISRLALKKAYCVLVSNPITLAHARRYGLKNCLYLPLAIDEKKYYPGPEEETRARWQGSSGGSFFVLTSMRLDNQWKGSNTAIEGFARFVKYAPDARLVVLGWGADEAAAHQQLAAHGIRDKVLLLPIVGKARLARYLRAADAFIEQFVLGYYGASGLEAIASGLPVIMRLERDQYDAMLPHGAPPVLDADDACTVDARLRALYDDQTQRKKIGQTSRNWFMVTHAGTACWRNYKRLLDAAAKGTLIDWTQSPLADAQSDAEVLYFKDQLVNAPRFPEYRL